SSDLRLLPTSFWAPSERLFFELLVNEIARELIGLVPAFQRAGVSPPTVQNAERELPLCDVGIAHITHFILATRARLQASNDVVNTCVVEVHPDDGVIAWGITWLFRSEERRVGKA